jgi:GNAT superfamily N-acetyltransferase
MTLSWTEEPIDKKHNRKGFDCGQEDLNTFLAQYARQAHIGGSAKTYCAIATTDQKTVLGFYTINPAQIELASVPISVRPSGGGGYAMGCFRLGRLAVNKAFQGKGLGGYLLTLAIERCMKASLQVGGTALLIDAKDEKGMAWYQLYGAVPLHDKPLSLIIPYIEFNNARVKAGLAPIF